jgi:hypothetical protein
MEMFPCTQDSLTIIKKWISESDYFLLLVARCCGTKEPVSGLSFTEGEYAFAQKLRIPTIVLFLDEAAPSRVADPDQGDVTAFKKRVKEHSNPQYWSTDEDLKGKISAKLHQASIDHPRTGWVHGWYLWAMIGALFASIGSSALWNLVCLIFGLPYFMGSRGVALKGPWAAVWGGLTCLPIIYVALRLRSGYLQARERMVLAMTYVGLGCLGGLAFFNLPVREAIGGKAPSSGSEVIIIICWSSILAVSSGLALFATPSARRTFDPRAFVRHWLGAVSFCLMAICYFLIVGWRDPDGVQFVPLRGFLAHTAVTLGMFWGLVASFTESS